jgi:TetR/AcrR family transcriptional regulator, transcriptional repressor for nem operon
MRYPADHKTRVRERIVQAASQRFRRSGTADVAIADLMRDLRLTHGGFYRHFRGKQDLFDAAFLAACEESHRRLTAAAAAAPTGRALEAIIGAYLSPEHCDNAEHGCPIAALSSEIARHPRRTRVTLDRAVRQSAAAVAPFMPGETPAEREQTAMVLFAGMSGVLTLARAIADPALRRSILEAARTFYLGLAGVRTASTRSGSRRAASKGE